MAPGSVLLWGRKGPCRKPYHNGTRHNHHSHAGICRVDGAAHTVDHTSSIEVWNGTIVKVERGVLQAPRLTCLLKDSQGDDLPQYSDSDGDSKMGDPISKDEMHDKNALDANSKHAMHDKDTFLTVSCKRRHFVLSCEC